MVQRVQRRRVIAVSNQKGGVGKTTTSVNLAAYAAQEGYKVLLIDADQQRNASSIFQVRADSTYPTLFDVWVTPGMTLPAACVPTDFGVWVAQGDSRLGELDAGMVPPTQARKKTDNPDEDDLPPDPTRLRTMITSLGERFDLVVIDCPPGFGPIMANALTAADHVLIPFQCDPLVLEGLDQLIHTIDDIRRAHNARLQALGIVLTMQNSSRGCSEVDRTLRLHYPQLVLDPPIGTWTKLKDMIYYGPISAHGAQTVSGRAYEAITREVLRRAYAS